MSQVKNKWLDTVADWFEANPEREFYCGYIPKSELVSVSQAGQLVGFASQPAGQAGFLQPQLSGVLMEVACVVRRADLVGGQPANMVFVLDGGMPPHVHDQSDHRPMESWGSFLWQAAYEATQAGRSLIDVLSKTKLIRRP